MEIRVPKYTGNTTPGIKELLQYSPAVPLESVRPESSALIPKVNVRLMHNDQEIFGVFFVDDLTLLARKTEPQSPVHLDSCVEFFVMPQGCDGYFNFEFNAIGTIHCTVKGVDSELKKDQRSIKLGPDELSLIYTDTSCKEPILTELKGTLQWWLFFKIQKSLFTKFFPTLNHQKHKLWLGNFYKCGDELSNPHWISWAPVDLLNFHTPYNFGSIVLE